MRRQIDQSMLEMALLGYKAKLEEVVQKMAEIERRLGLRKDSDPAPSTAATDRPKRTMSAAGKRAIRAALKKRWAAFHAQGGAVPSAKATAKPKRKLSPAAKARLAENLAKARAAKAKKLAARGA